MIYLSVDGGDLSQRFDFTQSAHSADLEICFLGGMTNSRGNFIEFVRCFEGVE